MKVLICGSGFSSIGTEIAETINNCKQNGLLHVEDDKPYSIEELTTISDFDDIISVRRFESKSGWIKPHIIRRLPNVRLKQKRQYYNNRNNI